MHANQFAIAAIASLLAVSTSMGADLAAVGVAANDLTPERAAALKMNHGAEIDKVTPDSPAAKAGLREKDVVLSVNNLAVDNAQGLTDLIRQTSAGASVKLTILRVDGQQSVIQVQTTVAPQVPTGFLASIPKPVRDCAASAVKPLVIQAALTGLACLLDLLLTGGTICTTLLTTAIETAPGTAIAACAGTLASTAAGPLQ